jgi:NADH-quinone oxidoreductase subunit C
MSEQAPPPQPTTTPAAQAAPAAPARSVDDIKRDPLVAASVARAGDAITDAKELVGEITLFVDRDRIADVARIFKNDGFNYLVDLAGVDYSKYPNHTGPRFSVAYTLYSFQKNDRVRLRVWTAENEPVPTVSTVWKTANWHERETYDMLGITFSGHPNLERILMWEGFNGHPLRKDFPIRGIDTGARIYPEVFPEGGGPKPGSTGKPAADVNVYKGDWDKYGTAPVAQIGGGAKPAAKPAPKPVAAAPAPAPAASAEAAAPAAASAEATSSAAASAEAAASAASAEVASPAASAEVASPADEEDSADA